VFVFRREELVGEDSRGGEASASDSPRGRDAERPHAREGGRLGGEKPACEKASLELKDNVREAAYERARERIFAGNAREDSLSSRQSVRSESHSAVSSRSASPNGTGVRARPRVAIARDRAADLKDPDFTRGATRFAPGVDETQTYVDPRRRETRPRDADKRETRRGEGRLSRDETVGDETKRRDARGVPGASIFVPPIPRPVRGLDVDRVVYGGGCAREEEILRASATRVDDEWLGDAVNATLVDARSRSRLANVLASKVPESGTGTPGPLRNPPKPAAVPVVGGLRPVGPVKLVPRALR
jgi:hypothetical protein